MNREPVAWTRTGLEEFLVRSNTAEPWHNRRYLTTFEQSWPAARDAKQILDVGGRSPFTAVLETFTTASVTVGSHDLREPFPHGDRVFDVVYCLEVLEHIKDRDSADMGNINTFTFSGVHNCLREILRVLKPDGLLVLSTPNVGSYRSLRNALEHRHPFAFELHNRELALTDVERLLTEAGFSIEKLTAINAWWNGGGFLWKARLGLLLLLLGYTTRNRSDDLLALARRPLA